MIDVLRAGPLTTVQDLGRPGWAHLGVPRSGALDIPALVAANRLVGNPDGAAGLEVTLAGCTLAFRSPTTIALAGADSGVEPGVVHELPAGAVLRLGPARRGVRTYVAVAGGIDVPPVLGSRSTDTLSGLGPAPLRDGDVVPIGAVSGPVESTVDPWPGPPPDGAIALRIHIGPRDDWFAEEARALLVRTTYTVDVRSNRIGVRLAGTALARARAGELPSEGIVLGAVQVPADGQPLVFLADHPTTGGYPVIGVVDPADLRLLAQARPGTTVMFRGPER